MTKTFKRAISLFISTLSCGFFGYHRNHTHSHNHRLRVTSNAKYFSYNMGKSSRPISLQTVELKVRMCCTGCERVVKDAILKLRGIDSIEVELPMEKVTVIGYVDRNKVLKAIRRSGKRAEFWPYPNPPLYFTSSTNYFKDRTHDYKESYNYYRHGYNVGDRHGTLPISSRGDDKVSNMFNDDNVNACSIM
ncbi:heavy metal-associated isoprenylated plant protein 30 [Beta vulgaris subsp. vulgaris]|uniref:heavy metal-associated isoprenylated plant protein 30 n=1 Tax=Beta vulgaris subsp. vulgaris TaxID=3555 RepID=UPI00053FD972|nr:heavy metal-associated isoprenylated plant protein 30 [Beta vulgaris subsp. vulgaris]